MVFLGFIFSRPRKGGRLFFLKKDSWDYISGRAFSRIWAANEPPIFSETKKPAPAATGTGINKIFQILKTVQKYVVQSKFATFGHF